MYTNLFDSHTHSKNSSDAFDSVHDICSSALHKGLLGICITDHFDCNAIGTLGDYNTIRQSYEDVLKAREAFAGKLTISRGIELGQPLENEAAAKEVLSIGSYDFILGSMHNNPGEEDFYLMDYSEPKVVIRDLLNRYFVELKNHVSSGYFDVLGHLTYPIRHIWGKHRIPVRLEEYQEGIDEVLRTLALTGKGMEINTSSIRQGMGFTMPTVQIVKRFRELGGEIITTGSDAHRQQDVGGALDMGMEVAKEAGFKYIAFFRERKPNMFKLV